MTISDNTNLGKLTEIRDLIDTLIDKTPDLVNSQNQKSAFDEMLIAEATPQVQLQFPYNINTDLINVTTTGTGTVTQNDNKAVLQTGASINSEAVIESKRVLKYQPGQGAALRFTAIFTNGIAGSKQLIGTGDDTDGFFFGYDGVQYGIMRKYAGTENWTYQDDWNRDKGDSTGKLATIDFTKGNVFQIRYQWLGFGSIKFYIENPNNGILVLVHEIEYGNNFVIPSIQNPALPLTIRIENTTNNTNISLQSSSMGSFTEGKVNDDASSILRSKGNTKTSIIVETNILTIKNKSIYQSKANRVRVKPIMVTLVNEGTKDVEFKIIENTTLGGSPNYSDINADNSVVEFDVAGTTISGGNEIITLEVLKNDSLTFPINIDYLIHPGDTLTISANSAQSSDVKVSFIWQELF